MIQIPRRERPEDERRPPNASEAQQLLSLVLHPGWPVFLGLVCNEAAVEETRLLNMALAAEVLDQHKIVKVWWQLIQRMQDRVEHVINEAVAQPALPFRSAEDAATAAILDAVPQE